MIDYSYANFATSADECSRSLTLFLWLAVVYPICASTAVELSGVVHNESGLFNPIVLGPVRQSVTCDLRNPLTTNEATLEYTNRQSLNQDGDALTRQFLSMTLASGKFCELRKKEMAS